MASMFARVGGTPAVTALVDNLYAKILSSPISAPVFHNKDIVRVKKYQVEFFNTALGSGTPYTGKGMKHVHTGLGITEEQYAAVAVMLSDTMKEMKIPEDIHFTVMNLAVSLKPDIVGL